MKTKGEVLAYLLPVIGGGHGNIEFTDQRVSFPIGVQQVGTALRVFVACRGCTGAAAGVLENATETQPKPEPQGPRTAIRVLTQTTQTFTH